MKKIKVLLIDDEKQLLLNIKEILELEGLEVVTGGNGREGLAQFEKERPDIIVCDIMMPDMDGYAFIQKLRQNGNTDIPFIFLTAKSNYDDIRTGMTIGADDYLIKPVKGRQIVEAIYTRLQRKKEINKHLEKDLLQLENGFKLVTDQEIFASTYEIINYLHQLKSKYSNMSGREVEDYLGYMEKTTGRLLKLLTKVKNWQEQKKALQENAVSQGITQVINVLSEVAKNAAKQYNRSGDLILNMQEDATLPLSHELLETLLNEILDNAFKFSDKGNPVVIGAMMDKSFYIIMVADCGKSTRAENLSNIKPFEIKTKAGSIDPGVGLGLSIAELIVKTVQGQLSFSNNSPAGILVTLRLPVTKQKRAFDDELVNRLKNTPFAVK